MKKKYTIYTKDARWFTETGWQGACRTQDNDFEESYKWALSINQSMTKWKIVDNETKKVLATNA